MIVSTPAEFRQAFQKQARKPLAAIPRGVFMVLPEQFRVNPESAVDNPYLDLNEAADPDRARAQAVALVRLLERVGVPVTVFPGRADQSDGVFPNNVFGTAPGRFIVGAMRHPGRRAEAARADIRSHFTDGLGYAVTDLSETGCVAELTGPLVIDRGRATGYCGMTDRVDEAGLAAMHDAFGLGLTFRFDLQPGEYHANVVLSVLAGRACVLVADAFSDADVPDAIESAYPDRTLRLSEEEKRAFCGNCIALTGQDVFMSQAAAQALDPAKRRRLESWGFRLHSTPLDEIEKAGGSLRCMLAEVF